MGIPKAKTLSIWQSGGILPRFFPHRRKIVAARFLAKESSKAESCRSSSRPPFVIRVCRSINQVPVPNRIIPEASTARYQSVKLKRTDLIEIMSFPLSQAISDTSNRVNQFRPGGAVDLVPQ